MEDGVCGVLIAEKLQVSQPTADEHIKILLRAGLVRAKRMRQGTFYKRDETQIKKLKKMIVARVYCRSNLFEQIPSRTLFPCWRPIRGPSFGPNGSNGI